MSRTNNVRFPGVWTENIVQETILDAVPVFSIVLMKNNGQIPRFI